MLGTVLLELVLKVLVLAATIWATHCMTSFYINASVEVRDILHWVFFDES